MTNQTDLWTVLGRSRSDPKFAAALIRDFEGAIKNNGYSLSPQEMDQAKATLGDTSSTGAASPISIDDTQKLFMSQQQEFARLNSAQVENMIELSQFTVKILKDTLSNAARTYGAISVMNWVMFAMGVGLFLFAAVEGAIYRNLSYTAAFAGLGAASFVSLFFLGPIDKTQVALSNLIQAEVAFMNYYSQIGMWDNLARAPGDDGRVDPAKINSASAMLQLRSAETIELLQKYLEPAPKSKPPSADEPPAPAAPPS